MEDSFELTNAATSLSLRHLISPEMTFTATGTGAYFLMVPTDVAGVRTYHCRAVNHHGRRIFGWNISGRPAIPLASRLRRFTFRLDAQRSPGGGNGAGHLSSAAEFHLDGPVGAGPLFVQSSSSRVWQYQDNSYAVNASHQPAAAAISILGGIQPDTPGEPAGAGIGEQHFHRKRAICPRATIGSSVGRVHIRGMLQVCYTAADMCMADRRRPPIS